MPGTLVGVLHHHVKPVLAGDDDLMRRSKALVCRIGDALRGLICEDGDLEDVVLDGQQIVDDFELQVLRHLFVDEPWSVDST